MPSEPAIMHVSAEANLDLNIEPSQDTTPWCFGHSSKRNFGKTWGSVICLTVRK